MRPNSTVTERVLRTLARLPLLGHPRIRRTLLQRWRWAKRQWRLLAERHGSARYSRPALHEMDRRLEPYLTMPNGIFVEAGANDGYRQSNTYYLERFRNWSGVLVEPVPELARQAEKERPRSQVVNAALVAADFRGAKIPVRFGGLSSAVEHARGWDEQENFGEVWDDPYEIQVAARTMTDILEEAGIDKIDFLSLDVEGYEPQALSGLDVVRYAPRFILVEIVDGDSGRERIDEILIPQYEMVKLISHHDYLYRRKV